MAFLSYSVSMAADDLTNKPEASPSAERIIRLDIHGKEYEAIDRGDGRDQQGRLMPGNTGNPKGRPKTKRFTDALNKYLDENPEKLDDLVEALVDRAIDSFKESDMNAAAVIVRDSIQGKPALTIQGDADNPLEVNLNDAKSKLRQLLGE